MLGTAFDIARSGLAAEGLRARVAAQNIANASTPDYVPQQVEQTSLGPHGGVQATVRPVVSPGVGAPVDLVKETTTLLQAKAAYEANLAVIVAVDQMTESLLDIFDRRDSDRDDR